MDSNQQFQSSKALRFWEVGLPVLIVVVFVALVGDWQWLFKVGERNRALRVDPQSVQYNEKLANLETLYANAMAQVESGQFTVREIAEVRRDVIDACLELNLEAHKYLTPYLDMAKSYFLASWSPPRDFWLKFKDETEKNAWAETEFWRQFNFELPEFRPKHFPQITNPDIANFLLWLLKWYYLFTLPGILILFVRLAQTKRSIKEKIFLEWREVLTGACFGPIGLAFVSEAANTCRRYRKLEYAYLGRKPIGYRISQAEQNALWLQTIEPLMRFEEALELAKSKVIPKPAFVCALMWLSGLTAGVGVATLVRHALVAIQKVAACDATPEVQSGYSTVRLVQTADDIGSSGALLVPEGIFDVVDSAMVAASVIVWDGWRMRDIEMIKPHRPRGPPAAARRDTLAGSMLSPDCTLQERRMA